LEHARVCCVIAARAVTVMSYKQYLDPSEEPASKLEERTKCEIFEDFFENGGVHQN
jgi:hypothetical protein